MKPWHLIVGAAGCAKTTTLTSYVRRAVERVGREWTYVCSLTRAAAVEIGSRLVDPADGSVDKRRVNTIHGLAYHALDYPEIAETAKNVAEWNTSLMPEWRITPKGVERDAPAGEEASVYQAYSFARTTMLPRDQWGDAITAFADRWTAYKRDHTLMDFNDLLEAVVNGAVELPCQALLVDEAQDLSALELAVVNQLARHASIRVAAGDPVQCQPCGTIVHVSGGGRVPIEKLVPGLHRVVSWSRREAEVRHGGAEFKITHCPYDGPLIRVRVAGLETRVTPEHRFTVKFVSAEKLFSVYLMQRDERWRVGSCKLYRNDGPLGMWFRGRCEKADRMWLLKVCSTHAEAIAEEAIISCRFGIPQTCFELKGHTSLTPTERDRIFAAVNPRGEECLRTYGRDPSLPFRVFDRRNEKWGKRAPLEIATANLFPEFMLIPVATQKKKYRWEPFNLSREHYAGPVYSLDVKLHAHYVVDGGIITHNSLYGWRGGNPDLLFNPDTAASVRTLDKSFRVPRLIQKRAEAIAFGLSKVSRRHAPRDGDDGSLTLPKSHDPEYPDPKQTIADALADAERYGMPSMLLATTHDFLTPWLAHMYEAGVPFHNPYRPTDGQWNPLASSTTRRVLSFLVPVTEHRLWTGPELHDWVKHLVVRGTNLAVHGGKARAKTLAETHPGVLTPQVLSEVLTDDAAVAVLAILEREPAHGAVEWLGRALNAKFEKSVRYRARVIKHGGIAALTATPKLIPSTVHGVKGGEAGAVYLRPDMTTAQANSQSMARVFYVALTRARHAAHVLASTRPLDGLGIIRGGHEPAWLSLR